jgi:hypothetical protein
MLSENFASSPNQLALFQVYVTIRLRVDAVFSVSLSFANFVASAKRARAALCEGHPNKACHSESRIHFPVVVKQAKEQRLKRFVSEAFIFFIPNLGFHL